VYPGIALGNQSILEQHCFDGSKYHSVLAISILFGLVAYFADKGLASCLPIQWIMGIGMAALTLALLAHRPVRT
jgi:hypothetical protein